MDVEGAKNKGRKKREENKNTKLIGSKLPTARALTLPVVKLSHLVVVSLKSGAASKWWSKQVVVQPDTISMRAQGHADRWTGLCPQCESTTSISVIQNGGCAGAHKLGLLRA